MIEGLRLLPWLHEATRRSPDAVSHYNDCARCRSTFSREQRQLVGCGWESVAPGAIAWMPEGWTDDRPTTCVGYTTKLPEVIETTEARFYLKHGSLSLLVKDEITDALRLSIKILENADAEATSWSIKNPVK